MCSRVLNWTRGQYRVEIWLTNAVSAHTLPPSLPHTLTPSHPHTLTRLSGVQEAEQLSKVALSALQQRVRSIRYSVSVLLKRPKNHLIYCFTGVLALQEIRSSLRCSRGGAPSSAIVFCYFQSSIVISHLQSSFVIALICTGTRLVAPTKAIEHR